MLLQNVNLLQIFCPTIYLPLLLVALVRLCRARRLLQREHNQAVTGGEEAFSHQQLSSSKYAIIGTLRVCGQGGFPLVWSSGVASAEHAGKDIEITGCVFCRKFNIFGSAGVTLNEFGILLNTVNELLTSSESLSRT